MEHLPEPAAEDLLRRKGLKATPQRLAIYDFLRHNPVHPKADRIYRQLRSEYPSLSLATVYKTLENLVKAGLAMAVNVGEGSFRFDGNTSPHSHLICQGCHRVEDLDDCLLGNLLPEVQGRSGYLVTGQAVHFYGYCPHCQGGESAEE